MNKSKKVVIGIVIGIVILYAIVFLIDYNRCSNLKEPIFTIHTQENDLSHKTVTYQGLGYKVQIEKDVTQEGKEQIIKVEMYTFNKFITGAITDIQNSYLNEDDKQVNIEERKRSFRAIVISSNLTSIEVEPLEKNDRNILSDKVSIGLGKNNDMLYTEGQELLITYTGDVEETYPTQIDVIDIKTETQYKSKIEDLPQDYSFINAIKDNCVVSVHNKKMYNKDELDRFVENVKNNRSDFMRCINFTTEGDMLITDVNFEGNNSFRVCFDWTRDEWSSKEDRTYKYCRYKEFAKEDTENGIIYYVDSPIEGELNKMYITGYESDTEIINNYEFNYLLKPITSGENQTKKITELSKKYDYDIYYYGLNDVIIDINGTEISLKEALTKDMITMEEIVEQAEKDSKAGIIGSDMYKEGGTMIYFYDTYTIIKSHSVDGNRDVYIGVPEMRLNMVR